MCTISWPEAEKKLRRFYWVWGVRVGKDSRGGGGWGAVGLAGGRGQRARVDGDGGARTGGLPLCVTPLVLRSFYVANVMYNAEHLFPPLC